MTSGGATSPVRQPESSIYPPLNESDFFAAVQQALHDFTRPDRLKDNPLVRSRLVTAAMTAASPRAATQALRELIRTHARELAQSPKLDTYYRIIEHTYLAPLRSQQAVTESLHLSWGTYRRHLGQATRMLSASLWEAETALADPHQAKTVPAPTSLAPLAKQPRRFWHAGLTLGLLVAVVIAGALYLYILPASQRQAVVATGSNPDTIAVLPLLNMDQDSNTQYLSDGITDELITRLGRIPGLHVVAHTSVFSLRNKQMDVQDVGRLLGVSYVLEGSLQNEAGKLRISAALVSTANGYELWSDEFTANQNQAFEIEDSISDAIVKELHPVLARPAVAVVRHYTPVNPEARDYYLVGLEYLNNRTADDINQSIVYFRRSIQADNNYAAPWAGLATAYAVLRDYQEDVPPDTHYADALAAANQAIALDPSLSRVHAILGLLHEEHWQWQDAQREFQLALQLDPSDATAHQWYGMYFWFTGDMQSALSELRTARDLDPLSVIINADLGRALCYAGDCDAALAQYRTTVALAPRFGLPHAFMAEAAMAEGQERQAVEEMRTTERLVGSPPDNIAVSELGVAYALADQLDLAHAQLAELKQRTSRMYVSGVSLAWLYWNLGDKTQAFEQLQRAAKDHDHLMMTVFGTAGAGMRTDPRFAQIRTLMNLPAKSSLQ
ncbi:MAG: tetratricopeptide repeat protein [Gammaproteobacteria bacterium]